MMADASSARTLPDRGPSPGALLSWWRTEVLGLSLDETAARLDRSVGTLRGWEADRRPATLDPFTIDRRLGAGRALGELLWASSTPSGLEPARQWSTVFRSGSDQSWIWVRHPEADPVAVFAEWGITHVRGRVETGGPGAIYWVPMSMPEQPMIVELSSPGWVDFGQGRLPDRLPGIPIVDVRDLVQRVPYPSQSLGELGRLASTRLRRAEVGPVDRGNLPSRLAAMLLDDRRGDRRPDWVERLDGHDAPPLVHHRAAIGHLRSARGLSLRQTVDLLRRRLDYDVSIHTVQRFETDSAWAPRDPHLAAALDTVLGAGGRLAGDDVGHGRGPGFVAFPHFWQGPVWIDLDGVEGPTLVRLRWGRWLKEMQVVGPSTLSTHCLQPDEPLIIEVPDRISWRAGVGRRSGARPIDRNWVPGDARYAAEVRALALDRAATAFRIRRERLTRVFGA
jgi:hypothetical protein